MPFKAPSATSTLQRATAAGTVDVMEGRFDPALTLTDQTMCAVISIGANTSTTPTINVDGLGAVTITTRGGAALQAGDIGPAGFVMVLEYNKTANKWELLNPKRVESSPVIRGVAEIISTNVGVATYPLILTNVGGSTNGSAVGITFDAFDGAGVTPTGRITNTRIAGADYELGLGPYSNFSAIKIRTSGYVGIGMTPTTGLSISVADNLFTGTGSRGQLYVTGASIYGVGIEMNPTGSGGTGWALFAAASSLPILGGKFAIYDVASGVYPVIVVSASGVSNTLVVQAGKVGVGVAPTTYTLHVSGTAGATTFTATNTSGIIFGNAGATTSPVAGMIGNTSGTFAWGVESSVGGIFFGGVGAYESVMGAYVNTAVHILTNNTSRFKVDANGNFLSSASFATNMTNGFIQIPGAAGVPSGVPSSGVGFPLYWDSTNLQLYVRTGGAWKKSAVFT